MNRQLIDTLRDLVAINSVNPAYRDGRPEADAQAYVRDFFARRGIDTYEQPVAEGRANLIAGMAGRISGRRLVFEAHCDTVSVEGMTIDPFVTRIADGRLYGRGACDVKAGLAAMMHALADVRASGVTPPCDIWVVSAVDEEHEYTGVRRLCEGLVAAGAVVAEPTGMKMAVASKGCLRWRMTVSGRAAHSSAPQLGANAIAGMMRLLLALGRHAQTLEGIAHPLVGSPTINVGTIHGGTQVNIVPASCSAEVDRRLIPGEDPNRLLEYYGAFLRDPLVLNGAFSVALEPLLCDWPLDTPAGVPLVRLASCVLRDLGLDGTPAGVAFGSDASKLGRAGIPSIILGPGHIDRAHTASEYVELEQVEQAFLFYRNLMSRFE